MMDHSPPDRTATGRQATRVEPSLRISLFGGIGLHIGDREVVLSRKAKALVAYLAVTPGMRETRDRLVGLLWSETGDAKARASLRQLLHSLRDAFEKEGVGGLVADKLHVGLDGSLFETDLDSALASIDRGDPEDWLDREPRIGDAFLRGYEDVDPSFGSWLTTRRESIRRTLIQRLEAQLAQPSYPAEATRYIAHTLFQIDPTHEIACQQLMRSYVAAGNTSGALAVYKQLWTCLEQEYDIEPSATTQQLVVAIRSGSYRPFAGLETPATARISNVHDVDSVILLAVKLAMAWATKPDAGSALSAQTLMRPGVSLSIADGV